MPNPRYAHYYHYISRCVLRAFLCERDQLSGNCYEHRRPWIEDKLLAIESRHYLPQRTL